MAIQLTSQHYINFQTVITGLRIRRASTSPGSSAFLLSISTHWIIDNSSDEIFINNICEFLLKSFHHINLPETLLLKLLDCIDYQSIITSKLSRSNSFKFSAGSQVTKIRNSITSFRDQLPFVDSTFEVAIDVAHNLFAVDVLQEDNTLCLQDDNSSRLSRINYVERMLTIPDIAHLYFEKSTIPFLIYAPPHSGKTTFTSRISAHLPVRSTAAIRFLDFYTEIHITDMHSLLSQAVTAIIILPSPGEFKSRCLQRLLPFKQIWYKELVDSISIAKARAPDRIRVVKTDFYVTQALMSPDLMTEDQSLCYYLKLVQNAISESSHHRQRPIFEIPGVF